MLKMILKPLSASLIREVVVCCDEGAGEPESS